MVTVVDGIQRFPVSVQMKSDANWDQLMQEWSSQAPATFHGTEKFPSVADAYTFKDADCQALRSMDESTRIFAHLTTSLEPVTTLPQPIPPQQRLVNVSIICQYLTKDRKYSKCEVRGTIHPEETEQNLLERLECTVHHGTYKTHWKRRAMDMCLHVHQYEWSRGNHT
jgi:hypothetical protein